MKVKRVVIFTDGASLGNPGQAAIGAIIKDEQGRLIARLSRRIGQATNNQAEYKAIIAALEEATRLGASDVDIRSDSQLVVSQISGVWRVRKSALKPLYRQVKQLQRQFRGFTITYIPGQQNMEAHNLAHLALS
jgi:ribonuclease HI